MGIGVSGNTLHDCQLVMKDVQIEDVTGAGLQQASEYVSINVLTSPYHGANVDGVQYFDTDRSGDPLTDMRGCLVEEGSINLFEYSSLFSDALWIETALSVVDNAGTSPDGSNNASKIVANSVNTSRFLYNETGLTSGLDYTQTVFAKAGELGFIQIATSTGFASDYVNFNLNTGAITGGLASVASMVLVGDGWYRCSVTVPATATGAGRMVFAPLPADLGRIPGWAGNDSDGLLIWGAQFEASAHASTYIPTEAVEVTRKEETLNVVRPVLTDKEWNHLAIGVSSYTVSDGASSSGGAKYLLYAQASGSNRIAMRNDATPLFSLEKNTTAGLFLSSIVGDSTSKLRRQVATLSPDTGITYKLNSAISVDADTSLLVGMNTDDNLIWLGTRKFADLHQNAGISHLQIAKLEDVKMLATSQDLVNCAGDELVVNGDFENGATGWTGMNVTGGVANTISTTGSQVISTVAGRSYKVTLECDAKGVAPQSQIQDGVVTGSPVLSTVNPTGNGVMKPYSMTFVAGGSDSIIVISNGSNTALWDNFSVKLIG